MQIELSTNMPKANDDKYVLYLHYRNLAMDMMNVSVADSYLNSNREGKIALLKICIEMYFKEHKISSVKDVMYIRGNVYFTLREHFRGELTHVH